MGTGKVPGVGRRGGQHFGGPAREGAGGEPAAEAKLESRRLSYGGGWKGSAERSQRQGASKSSKGWGKSSPFLDQETRQDLEAKDWQISSWSGGKTYGKGKKGGKGKGKDKGKYKEKGKFNEKDVIDEWGNF